MILIVWLLWNIFKTKIRWSVIVNISRLSHHSLVEIWSIWLKLAWLSRCWSINLNNDLTTLIDIICWFSYLMLFCAYVQMQYKVLLNWLSNSSLSWFKIVTACINCSVWVWWAWLINSASAHESLYQSAVILKVILFNELSIVLWSSSDWNKLDSELISITWQLEHSASERKYENKRDVDSDL